MPRKIELAYPDDARGWLKRGLQDDDKLRPSIRWSLTLPLIGVFLLLGLFLFFRVGKLLATQWGIDLNVPARGQAHSVAWLTSVLAAMVAIILICVIVDIALTMVWLVAVRGWAAPDAYGALVMHRYPKHWIQPNRL
jgi:fatty acid desaturase